MKNLLKNFLKGHKYISAKKKRSKTSNETELRNWRYGEFKKHSKNNHIDQLVLGHNLTDRIESTFLNLLRGSNLNGFIGMQIQETHHLLPKIQVLRPIL